MTSKGTHMNWDSLLRNVYSNAYKSFFNLKTALYSSALVMKIFNSSRKLF